jgi:hypothetical protein
MKSQPEDFIIQTRQVPALMRWRDRLLTLCLWILVGAWLGVFITTGTRQAAFYTGQQMTDPGLLTTFATGLRWAALIAGAIITFNAISGLRNLSRIQRQHRAPPTPPLLVDEQASVLGLPVQQFAAWREEPRIVLEFNEHDQLTTVNGVPVVLRRASDGPAS